MEKVKELVEKYGHKITGGDTINLSWQNGWGKDTVDLHRQLFDRMDDDSYMRSGPASWQTFGFTVTEDGVTYKITYSLDSGD